MFNNLEILKLRNSNLHGKIDNVFNLPSLQVLDIAINHLDGELPESLVQSKVLKTVDVSSNHFSGIIPMLSDVLSHGYYGMNSFSVDLLELLIRAPLHIIIDIYHNNFSGPVGEEIIKIMITKNIGVNMKGNSFNYGDSFVWSKSVIFLNHILNLGKCDSPERDNENPCSFTTPVPTNSILTDNQQTPVTDLAGFWVGMVIMILLMLSLAGACSYRYYKSIQQSVYAPQESSGEDMSILNNGVTTSV